MFSTIASKVPSGIDILVNNAGKLTFSDRTVNLEPFFSVRVFVTLFIIIIIILFIIIIIILIFFLIR